MSGMKGTSHNHAFGVSVFLSLLAHPDLFTQATNICGLIGNAERREVLGTQNSEKIKHNTPRKKKMSYNYNIGHRPQIWEKTKQEKT